MTKTFITKEQIKSAKDYETIEEPVPEWGGKDAVVILRTLTGEEQDQLQKDIRKQTAGGGLITSIEEAKENLDTTGLTVMLVAYCMIGENGERIYTTEEDVAELNKKSSAVLSRLFKAASKLNGMDAKSDEELEKN